MITITTSSSSKVKPLRWAASIGICLYTCATKTRREVARLDQRSFLGTVARASLFLQTLQENRLRKKSRRSYFAFITIADLEHRHKNNPLRRTDEIVGEKNRASALIRTRKCTSTIISYRGARKLFGKGHGSDTEPESVDSPPADHQTPIRNDRGHHGIAVRIFAACSAFCI